MHNHWSPDPSRRAWNRTVDVVVGGDVMSIFWWVPCDLGRNLARLVVDIPRTFRILEDGVGELTKNLVKILTSTEKLREIAKTVALLPVDAVIRLPNIIGASIKLVAMSIVYPVYAIEVLILNPPTLDDVRDMIAGPAQFFVIVVDAIVNGIAEALENHGLGKVAKLLDVFTTKVLDEVVSFLEKMVYARWKCTDILPSTVCNSIFNIHHKMVQIVKPFWNLVNKIGRRAKEILKHVIEFLIDIAISEGGRGVERYCKMVLPSVDCERMVQSAVSIDRFVTREARKLHDMYVDIGMWIIKHILH